jgi:hypothetical protein
VSTTAGRRFFDAHMAYLRANDLEGLLREQYTEDAIMTSPFDILDRPPPHILHAGPGMIAFLRRWLDYHGTLTVDALYDFCELDDSIFFQAIFSSRTGRWVVGDAWHMRDGKIDRHYSFAHRLGEGLAP